MSNGWEKISKDRISKKHKGGIITIKPIDESHPTIPLSCSLCGFLFKGMEDIIMFKRYGVCSECGLRWAQCRELEWHSGWRPSPKEIENYIKDRLRMPSYLIR
tara:strand:- start:257 stop:565 length:309 start_codon:yes stop_codon:yes gene_type:complete